MFWDRLTKYTWGSSPVHLRCTSPKHFGRPHTSTFFSFSSKDTSLTVTLTKTKFLIWWSPPRAQRAPRLPREPRALRPQKGTRAPRASRAQRLSILRYRDEAKVEQRVLPKTLIQLIRDLVDVANQLLPPLFIVPLGRLIVWGYWSQLYWWRCKGGRREWSWHHRWNKNHCFISLSQQ